MHNSFFSTILVTWCSVQTKITVCGARPEASVQFTQTPVTLHKVNLALLFSFTILNDRLHEQASVRPAPLR